MLLCFVFWVLTSTSYILTEDHYLSDNNAATFLYLKFDNITEEIFPNNIRMRVYMSSIDGTLFYGIDRNMNQLIVSLPNEISNYLEVELNTQKLVVSLYRLCECTHCRYQILDLQIQINDYIVLQCNNGNVRKIENKKKRDLNMNYPTMFSNINQANSSTNEAHMWLMNIPLYKQYPNKDNNILGCIFDVSYNDIPINYANVVSNIGPKCKPSCDDTVCNGGQCYDNYNGASPTCDCTTTFLNGQYCNDRIFPMNSQSFSETFIFKIFKLSWNSSVDLIFEMKNGNISIILARELSKLFFEYTNIQEENITSKVTLTDYYTPNHEYVCIVKFQINNIDIRLLYNHTWRNHSITTSIDLRREIFDSLLLQSGDGSMDMVHKGYNEYRWRKVHVINTELGNGPSIYLPMLPVKKIMITTIALGTIGVLFLWFVVHLYQQGIMTVLHGTYNKAHCILTRLLLYLGTDLNHKDNNGRTKLHNACDTGNYSTVKLLLDQGCDINYRDNDGWTGLHHACDNGHDAIVSLLLNRGSDCDYVNNNGLTALHLACAKSHDNVIKVLMARGSDNDNLDNNGQTVLHFACEKGYCPTVQLLLDRGWDINCRDKNGSTALHSACRCNQNQIVQFLLKKNSDFNLRDNDGWTALHYACGNGHDAIARLLLECGGLDIDCGDFNGITSLHYACNNGHYEIVQLLLKERSNINCTNINGHTVLHYACGNGHEAIVQLLLDRGSDITCRNNYGKTPWDMARQNNHNKIILILEQAIRVSISNGLNDNGWTKLNYRFIAAINQCNDDNIALFVNDILEIFNNKYKSEMIEHIHKMTPLTERMRISIDCLVAALQCQLPNNDNVCTMIVSLLELYPYTTNDSIVKSILEIILYNFCQYNQYQTIKNNDKLRSIITKCWSNENISEKIKLSLAIIICHTIVDINKELNSDKVRSYLSDVIKQMEGSDEYNGFTRQCIIDAISKMGSIIEEDTDRKYVHSCMRTIGWHIVPKSKAKWMPYIKSHMTPNVLLESRLDAMYNAMKDVRDTEYWMNITVLFVHARIFVLPSNTEGDPRSIQYLMTLLNNKYNYGLSSHRHYVIECMMDLIEDAAYDKHLNKRVSTIMDTVLSFVAYYSIIDNYKYQRDLAFLDSYLTEDTKVSVWANVIICFCADGNRYSDILSHYLGTDDDVTKDKIIVYMAFIKSMERATEAVHPKHQWSNIDYCLVAEIREYKLMPRDNIASFNSNIIRIFSKVYKDEIIKNISDDRLTESDKHLINCLCVSLHCESIYNDDNESITISMLEEFYPHAMDSIVAMRIVEIILHNVCKYNRYKIVSIRDRIRYVCLQYWTNENISEEIKLHSSVIICHTTEYIDDRCDIGRYIKYLCDVVHGMNLRSSNITFGLSEQEIKAVISKVSVTIAQQMIEASMNIEYLERISSDINGTMNLIGIMTFTVNRFKSNKHEKKLIYSPYFYTHKDGYKLRLQIYPGGNKIGTHLSVYIYICKGDHDDELLWPCRHRFTLSVVNQDNGAMNKSKTFGYDTRRHTKLNMEEQPQTNYKSYGHQQLIPHSELESVKGFIVNDCIIIKCDTLLLS